MRTLQFVIVGLTIAVILLGIGGIMRNKQIDNLLTLSDKQSKWIENLQARVFVLEADIAITDLGYAEPGRGIPDAYWQMYLFEQIRDLPMGDSTPLGPIWEQAVKDYWGHK